MILRVLAVQAAAVPTHALHRPSQAQPAAARAGQMLPPARGGWGEGPMAPRGALMLGPDAWEQKDVLALADELDLEDVGAGPRISTAAAPRAPERVRGMCTTLAGRDTSNLEP